MLMQSIESYLQVRRATGYALKDAARALRSFARFAGSRGETHVRGQTAIEWAGLAAPSHRYNCLRAVVHFARHVRAEDDRHEVPPQQFFRRIYRRPTPFIFTPSQISQLVRAAARVTACCPGTYSTLFGLLAVTGLRISEALALRFDDLTADGLVIRQTKFRKTRLVPLHETTRGALDRYLSDRHRVRTADDRLFLSKHRGGLHYPSVNQTFRRLLRVLGILSEPQSRPCPRIHSLRHSFAVRALESCPEGRDRVEQHMLALSTYLGHSSVTHTYWYLQATPHLMSSIADACEALVHGAVP